MNFKITLEVKDGKMLPIDIDGDTNLVAVAQTMSAAQSQIQDMIVKATQIKKEEPDAGS
jgi:hypothetical protein